MNTLSESQSLKNQLLTLAPLPTKITTSLFGLAICDALGGPAEFRRRGTFPEITSMIANTNFQVPAGAWTDDTSMALCLASSLIVNNGEMDLMDQARRYYSWIERGYMSCMGTCFDCGSTIARALRIWEESGFESEMKGMEAVKRELDRSGYSGNGGLMRTVPVALAGWRDVGRVVVNAGSQSTVTHPVGLSREACEVYCFLVATILGKVETGNGGFSKADLWEVLCGWKWKEEKLEQAVGKGSGLLEMKYEDIKSSGYVLHSLQAALWAFFSTKTFEEGAIRTVNMGDDADTVAAIYGGLAGCWYGDALYDEKDGESVFWSERVKEWRRDLQKPEMIQKIADGLIVLNGGKKRTAGRASN